MILLNYQVTEHFKNEDKEYIKLTIQNIIANLIISEKMAS